MKNICVIIALSFFGCKAQEFSAVKESDMSGTYIENNSSEKIELKSNGTYTLYKAPITFSPVIEQCDYASNGKWSVVAKNVLEITSENYSLKQKGFNYDIKKENKFSQDSLYIRVVFPTDFHSLKLSFTFNHNNSKSISTDETYIVLPKSEYLWNRRTSTNQIGFSLNANVSGTTLYKSRILFEIFDKEIDTEKYNYLTISLPNFDRCFFEFEPYYKELIYIKSKNALLWRGEIWDKEK